MKRIHLFLPALFLLFASCGLSPEDQATPAATDMTAQSTSTKIAPTAENTEILEPTAIPTFALTETAMPEIGGDKVVVLWRDNTDTTIPEAFKPYLTPITPMEWQQKQELTMSDGSSIPLGSAVSVMEDSGRKSDVVPGLVRKVVEYGTYNGEPEYGAIIAFPVK